jgi:Raf kinase inhibitor-like YbhB/YbcL family protein
MAIRVESTSLQAGERIPEAYAFGVPDGQGRAAPAGGNRNPHLRWSGASDAAASFAVLVVDFDVPANPDLVNAEGVTIPPDAARRPFAHWLIANLPSTVTEIAEGADSDGIVPRGKPPGESVGGGITGANDYTGFLAGDPEMEGTYGGYDGPFPPWNDELVHRYRFRVYALDVPRLDLEPGFDREALEAAMEGHILDSGELLATYAINPDART